VDDYDALTRLIGTAVVRDVSLESLLGIDRKALRRELRDDALRKAWEMMPGPSPWMQSRQLANAVLRHQSRGHRGPVGDLIRHAELFGPCPCTPERIHQLARDWGEQVNGE